MNYGWARDFTLELINQYSMAGKEIPASYNNQADYLARIPKLLDDAQHYVATTTGKIRELANLEELPRVERGEWLIYTLPANCWQICGSGLVRFDGPRMQRSRKYFPIGRQQIAVPRELDGLLSVEYYRYPVKLGLNPKDNAPMDNTEEAQRCLPYYVAAHLLMQDNPFAYASLYNEFEAKLARLTEVPHGEIHVMEDSYSVGEWEYDY